MNITSAATSFLIGSLRELAATFKEEAPAKVTKQQQAMIDALLMWGEDYREKVAAFATALAGLKGEEFDFRAHLYSKTSEFKTGMIVVPLTSKGGHHYELNVPTCIIAGPQGWRLKEETIGDSLSPLKNKVDTRLATQEEIDLFFTTLLSKSNEAIGNFFKTIIPKLDFKVSK